MSTTTSLEAAINRMINIWKEQVYPNAEGRSKFINDWTAGVIARVPEGAQRDRLLNMAAGARTLYVDAITPPKPVATPAAEPVAAPVAVPVAEPVAVPVAAPVAAPAVVPVAAPVAAPVTPPVAAPVAAKRVVAPVPEVAPNAAEIWDYIQMLLDVVNSNSATFDATADVAPAGARDTIAAALRAYSAAHTTFRNALEAAAGKVFDGGMNEPVPAANARPDWEGADDDDEDA